MIALKGRVDAYDVTVARMKDYQHQQARLSEEVRKLKRATGVDAAPGEAGPSQGPEPAIAPASTSRSDPLCSVCAKRTAYDMPMRGLLHAMTGKDTKLDLADLFTFPGGRVKANSGLKKMVQCEDCITKGVPRLVVCTSGGAGNRLQCEWCRARMTSQTTGAATMWCGKRHSNCRQLVVENETDRHGNSIFLSKGLALVREVVPWDELRLVDTDLAQFNDCDYAITATSSLSKQLALLEIDNNQHAGGGQYSAEAEQKKNTENLASGRGFDKVLLMRISPSGKYKRPGGEEADLDKRARWLIARDWLVTWLRAPYGTWTLGDKAVVYLFYDHDSQLIDRRPIEFTTVVAYQAPALPTPAPPDLADWACTLDPYLVVKGSTLTLEHLALPKRRAQPARSE